jgi:hypothetical protein
VQRTAHLCIDCSQPMRVIALLRSTCKGYDKRHLARRQTTHTHRIEHRCEHEGIASLICAFQLPYSSPTSAIVVWRRLQNAREGHGQYEVSLVEDP